MKQQLILILLFFSFGCDIKKSNGNFTTNYSKILVGRWNYVETRNNIGVKIDTINIMGIGKLEATGPQIILNKDGSYKKEFTSMDSDSGFWKINEREMLIEYDLFIDSTVWAAKYLIEEGLASKRHDGNYYEKISDEILKIGQNEMILEWRGYQQVYKKEKK